MHINLHTYFGLGGRKMVLPSFRIALQTALGAASVPATGSFSFGGAARISRSCLMRCISSEGVQDRMISVCGLALPSK